MPSPDLQHLLTQAETFALTYGTRLIAAVIVCLAGFRLVNILTKKLHSSKALSKIDLSAKSFAESVFSASLKLLTAVTSLAVLGVPMTSIAAVIGSCGLAIGLALQGSLANIAGGFIILLFKPFKTGDFISAGDISGTVESIGIFHTKLITVDNKRIVAPNASISNATLTNFSALDTRRVDLDFNASYDDDIDTVEAALLKVCNNIPEVLPDPEPFARLSGHLDSSLKYTVRVWCKNEDYWNVHFALLKAVKKEFDAQGISIPYPQADIHTKK